MSAPRDQHEHLPELCSDDRRLLDALVDVGFDARALEPLSDIDRRRVQRLMSMFQLLHDYPVEDADDSLVDATMARINRYEQQRTERMRFDAQEAVEVASTGDDGRRRFLRVPLPDFITVAAVLLIGVGVGWPILNTVQQNSIDQRCANNLRKMNIAFSDYAADYNGAMPTAQAGLHNSWNVLAHNVVNLSPLLENGYCELNHLNCPGHEGEVGASYSYQWQVPGRRITWDDGRRVSVVLGDRNPLIDAARRGRYAPPLTVSLNHGGRGQNVLWNDGSIVWLDQPVVGGNDNIWLPNGVEKLTEGAPAGDPADTFLAH